MTVKTLALRRDDHCLECGIDLPAGSRAQWDSIARVVTCLPCVAASPSAAATRHPETQAPAAEPSAPTAELDLGTPGASARREAERRQAKRQDRLEKKWGTGWLGKIAKVFSDDPQSTKAWTEGAKGEETIARILHDHLGDRAVLLHDRRVPGTRGNIDHVAVAPSGVWIIDAKKYEGEVKTRDVGGWFRTDIRLYVNGRDRSKAVAGMDWQRTAVREALGGEEIPIHCALCFTGAEWPLFRRKPLRVDDVWIGWTAKLAELIAAEGPLHADSIEAIARDLSEILPSNPS